MRKRTQGKMHSSILTSDLYRFYKENYNEAVSSKAFSDILKLLNSKIADLIYTGFTFSLTRFGRFHIAMKKTVIPTDEDGNLMPYKGFINFGATNKLWKEHPEYKGIIRIFYENDHFNGNKVNLVWNKMSLNSSKVGVKGMSKYVFTPCRSFKRNLAKYVFAHPETSYYIFNKTKNK